MSFQKKAQLPISTGDGHKSDVRTQFGALCFRIKDRKVQILLITSRRRGRWIIPKGWPMDQKRPAAAAKREAYEEAGVEGKAYDVCLGLYSYTKAHAKTDLPVLVAVFPVRVRSLAKKFPEQGQRKRKWVSLKKAAQRVEEPELKRLLLTFDPTHLPI